MSITTEQAAEMQSRVKYLAKAHNAYNEKPPTTREQNRDFAEFLEAAETRQNSPHSERSTKTGATIGAKAERGAGAATGQPQAKKSKYRNRRVVIDGIKFQSILEGHRYGQLKLLKAAGEIKDFEMQVVYSLDVNNVHICDYRADFVVWYPGGRIDVEDTKGVETPDFKLKKKLMLAIYGIEIKLIRK